MKLHERQRGELPLRDHDHSSHAGGRVPSAWPLGDGVDSAEFDEHVADHIPTMLRAASSILGSEPAAWDAVQETLLRVWMRGYLPEQPGPILVQLTIRSSLHQLRCDRRRRFHESAAQEPNEACCEADPLLQLESSDEVDALRKAIAGLTQEYRTVLDLLGLEGRSYEAIAERLGLPIGTVRSRISRGRALLRTRLEAENSGS